MSPKRIWKNLDEFYGDPAVEAMRQNEFEPEVAETLKAVRAAAAENGDVDGPNSALQTAPSQDDLRSALPAFSRRGFLQLGGAAAVFGLTSCWHNPPSTLVPYHQQPEGHVLGRADWYSTTVRAGGQAVPVMAKCYDYRPIKLEGNPDCDWSKGRLDLAGQATLLDLYDPDRLYQTDSDAIEGPLQRTGEAFASTDWASLDQAVGQAIAAEGKVGLLTGAIDGPAHAALLAKLKAALGDRLEHVAYSPYAADRVRDARVAAFGPEQAVDPVYRLDQASVLVTLGSDPLANGQSGLFDQVNFGEQRRLRNPGKKAEMGNLITFEAVMSQTGTCADLRTRVDQQDLASVGWALAFGVAERLGKADQLPAWAAEEAERGRKAAATHSILEQSETWKKLSKDDTSPITYAVEQLVSAHEQGQATLVYAGGGNHSGAGSVPLLVVAQVLNHLLDNEGRTVLVDAVSPTAVPTSLAGTRKLLDEAIAGGLSTLIVCGANPLFALPEYTDGLKQAADGSLLFVACNDRVDETAVVANWVAPITHDLESWGDAEPRAGSYSLQQPVVVPLWDVRQWQDSLLAFATAAGFDGFAVERPSEVPDWRSAVHRKPLWVAENYGVSSWKAMVESVWSSTVFTAVAPAVAARDFWLGALGTGVVSAAGTSGIAKPAALNAAIADHRPAAKAEGWSLVLNPSRTMGDGSAGNNPWLQETPDPVTRVTWDPWVAISITDAKALGLGKHGILNIDIGGPEPVQMPAYVQPGQASGSLDVVLGYGRRRAGAVAEVGGVSGIQVNAFTMADGDERIRVLPKAAVSAADGSYKLASTQYHQYMDGRDIALDDQLELHRKDPGFKKRKHLHIQWEGSTGPDGDPTATGHNLSLYNSQIVYPGRRWGMNVDLTTCNGCNACVVACNAENNVPVVGRDEVRIGREMHWMRIDRYYTANSLTKHDEKYGGKDASVVVEAEDPDDVEVIHQPVMCQQCGHAPCEEVCPAMATMHNDEGQNVQVYNRCIGTRYCANNCAYKVRRFNFYEYSKYRFGPQGSGDPFGRIVTNLVSEGSTSSQDEMMVRPLNMVLNPLVTLRSKGVMEKCNFCLQRTREIREEEKRTNTKYDETAKGAITVACAQTCPTGAITFGDINDPDSLVSKERGASPHGYKMLDHYLNTRPSVDYHRRIRNRPPVKDEAYKLADKKTADKKKTDDHGADAEHGHGDHGEAH